MRHSLCGASAWRGSNIRNPFTRARHLCQDTRTHLSGFWTPTQAKTNHDGEQDLLIRAGFLRQAHSGVFHLLPLGSRVLSKLEALLDKHMTSIGACKVSLSSISSQDLWRRTGRLHNDNSEFFKLEDRKKAKFLLAPTHEEEITSLVADAVSSYKELPLRLYQISRKYRDEARPRQGLLRGREFVMKDLYTFDVSENAARGTYERVRTAYRSFFDDLGIPYVVASADSGNMGGNLSHEYHFLSHNGEDIVITCGKCDFSINEELDLGMTKRRQPPVDGGINDMNRWMGLSKDRKTVVKAYYPSGSGSINTHAIKLLFPDLDQSVDISGSERDSLPPQAIVLIDPRVSRDAVAKLEPTALALQPTSNILTKAQQGDPCPKCQEGSLRLDQAIEIGHTFHLGTRYTVPLGATVSDAGNTQAPISMGCHGIGVSRIIGAVASLLADDKGLNWPLRIAPFSCVVVAAENTLSEDVNRVYDQVATRTGQALDVAIDDREKSLGWKLKDADLIGYPFIIVLGKAWRQRQAVELQCRRLGLKEVVDLQDLAARIEELAARL